MVVHVRGMRVRVEVENLESKNKTNDKLIKLANLNINLRNFERLKSLSAASAVVMTL